MKQTLLIHEGQWAAQVIYEEYDDGSEFAPIMKKEDALKMDRVRLALRRGDVTAAAKESKVFQMMPMAGE